MSGHPTRHTDSLLRKAVQHHKAGQTERAARFYREILRLDPGHGDAAHLLGRIAHQDGRPQTAAALFTTAARGNATVAPYHLALGLAQWDSGNQRAAAASARRTLALCPDDADALCLLGAAAGRLGDRRTALRCFHAAVRAAPRLSEARTGLGRVWERLGCPEAALGCYRAATRLRGCDADGWRALADAFRRLNRPLEAASAYQEALRLRLDWVAVWAGLGSVWHAMGLTTGAQEAYTQALRRDPTHADARNNLGLLRLGVGQDAAALRSLTTTLTLAPQHGPALVNQGLAEASVGRFDAAVAWHRRAIALDPNQSEAWNNLGVARKGLGQAATACWKRALALNPAFADALGNLGVEATDGGRAGDGVRLLRRASRLMPEHAPLRAACARALCDAGRLLAAAEHSRKALALVPSLISPRQTLAMIEARLGGVAPKRGLMALGVAPPAEFCRGILALDRAALAPGWDDCLHRPDHTHPVPARMSGPGALAAIPEWGGETLAGKRLIITTPSEACDVFSAAACWPDALTLAERVDIRCTSEVAGLLARAMPRAVIRIVGDPDADESRDMPTVQSSAAALPDRLRGRLGRLPVRASWLYADAGRMMDWRDRLDRLGGGLRVGVIQRGTGERTRALSAIDWEPVLRVPGLVFLDLSDERVGDGPGAASWAAPLSDGWRGDVEETAALLSCLDLMIAPPRSLAELAAALGVPVWCYGVRAGDGALPFPVGAMVRAIHPTPGQALASVVPRIATDLRRLARLNRADDAAAMPRDAALRRLN